MHSFLLLGLVSTFILTASGKLLSNQLDEQLETNMVNPNHEPPPPRMTSMRERDWVKISEAPPLVINARLAERVEIECEAIGSPAPEIQWYRGDRLIKKERKSKRMLAEKAALAKVKSRIVIDCVNRKDEGFYTCSATAGEKSVKSQSTLILIDGIGHGDLEACNVVQRLPPRITSWTPTAMENMGYDVLLPCSAVGTPAPSVYWLDPQNNVLNSLRHQVSEAGDLTISRLAWSDMGEYTCVAENALGRDSVSTFVYPVMNRK